MARRPSHKSLRDRLGGRAKAMRREPTAAEAVLWAAVRNRQRGAKFRRQVPVDRFILDFYCPESRLVIEVDGDVHRGRSEPDAVRQSQLERLGLHVLRVGNEAVLHALPDVLQRIDSAIRNGRDRIAAAGKHPGPLMRSELKSRRGR